MQEGLPWFSLPAIKYLDRTIKPGSAVFEFGSGGSTVYFASKHCTVDAVEDSADWCKLVADELSRRDLPPANLTVCPFDFFEPESFRESDYFNRLSTLGRKYDVIVVDGTEESVQVRRACLLEAEKFIKPGGIIILDDSWRYKDPPLRHHAKSLQDFVGIGPCRKGVTSTAILQY